MPLKITTVKGVTTLSWESSPTAEDSFRQTATFKIRPEMTEEEKINTLIRASAFIGKQMGLMPGSEPGSSMNPTALATTATTSATPTEMIQAMPLEAPSPSPTSGLILGSGSFSDKPSDGGPPQGAMGTKFWENMPTMAVPPGLASPQGGGWEMDTSEGWE